MYKLLTKIIVSKFKPILPKMIAPNQCCLVPSRQIFNNMVVVQIRIYKEFFCEFIINSSVNNLSKI